MGADSNWPSSSPPLWQVTQQRIEKLEQLVAEGETAALELAKVAQMQAELGSLTSGALAAHTRRQAWWNRALVLVALVLVVRLLTACSGAPFESSSLTGSQLAGAQSSAGALAAGSSAGLSGGGAGNNASGDGGVAGVDVVAVPHRCDVSTWKASAFATSVYLGRLELAAYMLDGDASTRWASGVPREPLQWVQLELGAGVDLVELHLSTAAVDDMPSAVALELDGKATPATLEPAGGVLVIRFASTPATSARLVLTGSAPAWWSIAELGGLCQ